MPGLLDTILGTNDPSTADPVTGLLDSQRRQLAFSTLGNTGALLLAAGQEMMPGERGRILANLANVPQNTMQMQSQLMAQNAYQQRAQRDQRQEAADAELSKVAGTPEFIDALKQMPPEMQQIVPALVKSGRAREAITMVDNWRNNQTRTTALQNQAERVPFGWEKKPDGSVRYIPNGPADPEYIARANLETRGLKPIPVGENDKLSAGAASLSNIDGTLEKLNTKPGQNRVAGFISRNVPGGDLIAQTIDPEGVDYRAAIANVSSQILQARSGLAVTESEYRRLVSLLPQPSDDPSTIKTKLGEIRQGLAKNLAYQAAQYTKENGFIPHSGVEMWSRPAAAPAPTQGAGQQGGGDAPPASALKEGHVTTFGNGQKWMLQGGKPMRVQ